ncbi:MAG TPA: cytochrome d ubiquinol oxidase subunit II [Trebonia sp.]|jgi:cytochrome d ubiquinol oxidase subunit II|nr:cytochrome d ubiquinol oxidase subunit II [Trebonia sp.]
MADAVGAILLASVTLYAVLAGADFGAGLWDLLAGTSAGGRAPRGLIDESITPVWEANHVWLVFDLVIFWTAFPHAFATVMTTLALPLWLALGGVVLRGAGFAFRKELTQLSHQRAAGAVFAFSSLLTPFFMGTVVGAIAAGAVPADASRASLAAWTSPTALLAGFLFVAAGGYLAAVYLVVEAGRRGDQNMQAYFTRRAQAAAVVAGALSLAALFELQNADPAFFDRLTGRALPLVVVAGVCGLAVLALLAVGRAKSAQIIAALGVAAVIWGWGVAQYPVLLPGTGVTLTTAGATQATFVALVVIAIAAVILVVPSFVLLFFMQGRRLLSGDEHGLVPAVAVAVAPGRHAEPPPAPPVQLRNPHMAQIVGAVVVGLGVLTELARRLRSR